MHLLWKSMVGFRHSLRSGFHIAFGAGYPREGATETMVVKNAHYDVALTEAMKELERNPRGTVAEVVYFFARGWTVKIWTFQAEQAVRYKGHGIRRLIWHDLCSWVPPGEYHGEEVPPHSITEAEEDVVFQTSKSIAQAHARVTGSSVLHTPEEIRPEGLDEIDVEDADLSKLLAFEVFMGHMPIECSGVFAVTCLLGPVDQEGLKVLRTGLETVVSARPMLAGRVNRNNISLCHAGVPFTVVDHTTARPMSVDHDRILSLCDIHDPKNIMAGRAPLLTVKIHVHPDGAVLGVAASHCLMDGSSLFAFLKAWGKACRGQTEHIGDVGHRSCLQKLIRDSDRCRTVDKILCQAHLSEDNVFGKALRKADAAVWHATSKVALNLCSHLLTPFLSIGKGSPRLQLCLSNSQMQEIKDLAMPLPETAGDGWVSTQEAIVAYLTLALWRSFFSRSAKHDIAQVSFLVDVRKPLGINDNVAFGTGFQPCSIFLESVSSFGLRECAAAIHERYKAMIESAAKNWCLFHRAFEYRIEADEFVHELSTSRSADMSITINNNSKRQAPDFGALAGGQASDFMSNMGPTLFVATASGMDIFLEAEALAGASSAKVQEFKHAFQSLSLQFTETNVLDTDVDAQHTDDYSGIQTSEVAFDPLQTHG